MRTSNAHGRRPMWALLAACGIAFAVVGGVGISQAAQNSSAAAFVAVSPIRMIDTRVGMGGATLRGGDTLVVTIAGQAGVATEATAVTVNVTVVGGTAPSYLTLWPTGAARPVASNVNWHDASPVANLVTVQLGTGGAINVYNAAGSVDVIVDLSGYYLAAALGGPGPAGPPGPAGAFGLVDATGVAIPGRILSLQQIPDLATGQLAALVAIVLDDNNAGISWDVLSGSAGYAAAERVFTTDNCTATSYWDLAGSGAPLLLAVKFVDARSAQPGDPMFRPTAIARGVVVESRINTGTGGCDDTAPAVLDVVTATPAGTAPANRLGPLAFASTR